VTSVFAAWILLLRRPVAVLAALTPTRTGASSVAFLSWFGPLGVGSIYYATYVQRFDLPQENRFFAVVSLVVVVSMIVHTLTATTGMRWYAPDGLGGPGRGELHPPRAAAVTPGVGRGGSVSRHRPDL